MARALGFSAATIGIDGYVVRLEADAMPGAPSLAIIGLPDRALAEARERIRGAVFNSGFTLPAGRLLVNLSPTDVRKEGPSFDLPCALTLLALDGQIDPLALQQFVVIGELALDGTLRSVNGILPMVLGARRAGIAKVIVPADDVQEALLVDDIEVYGADEIAAAVAVIDGKRAPAARSPHSERIDDATQFYGDFADVRGQDGVKRMLEVAAAGGHHALLSGPPGCGKTMLARRLPSIMPPLNENESLEVTAIYSSAGLLGSQPELVRVRPFRFPHFTVSQTALSGGGSNVRPGEMSLAHHGVLFFDQMHEFTRTALDSLRQPLDEGLITIVRAQGTFTFPARFTLVGSIEPCACGHKGTRAALCRCTPEMIAKHFARLPGPLLDRLELQAEVARVPFDEMARTASAERSATIRQRVVAARNVQQKRFAGTPITCNAEIPGNAVRTYCAIDGAGMEILAKASAGATLSARAVNRIARVARTIADLAGSEAVAAEHVTEALSYRVLDRALTPA